MSLGNKMPKVVTLPSGLTVEIRGLKGREGKLLTSREVQKSGDLLERLIGGCWLKTIDPGPYSHIHAGETSIDWSKVLMGDIMAGVIAVRDLSFGNEYAFKTQCTDPGCRKSFEWELDLSDLPRQDLPESSKDGVKGGNKFPAVLKSNGRKLVFNLVTSDASKRLNDQMRRAGKEEILIASIAARIEEIDGIEKRAGFRKFLEDCEFSDLTDLLSQMEEADCGLDLELDVECPQCDKIYEVSLPLDQAFLMPVTRRPTAKRQAKEGEK